MLPQKWLEENVSAGPSGRIIIDGLNRDHLKGGAYTFTLSPEVRFLRQQYREIDLRDPDSVGFSHFSMEYEEDDMVVIKPGEFLHCITQETLKLPDDIACLLSTHPSAAKVGVDFLQTSTFIPPGSECRITLETKNNGPCSVVLYPGMKAVKAVFFEAKRVTAFGI